MKLSRTFIVSAAFVAGFFIFISPASAETVIWHAPEERIIADTVWHTGEIHVISGGSSFYVNPNVTLTVEPGVIIKVGYNGIIRVFGNLIASGTKDNMIKIVSLRDDSVGGDTNGDGSATSPAQDDWRGIHPSGYWYNSIVNIDLNYVTIKHGGRGVPRGMVIYVNKVNSLKINNCNIVDNLGVIMVDYYSRNVSINNSNIYNPSYCNYSSSTDLCHWNSGVKSYSPSPIDVTHNYWGSASGPIYTTGTDPIAFNGTILANLMGADIAYAPYAVKPFDFGTIKRHPVILIPGFLGSWPDMEGNKLILDPVVHTYDDLWLALIQAGYATGTDLFAFPYEWRNSNVVTARLLQAKIAAVKALCISSDMMDCSKVDLVAHSMGGLVARQYIDFDDYAGDVDQLIFIATPHKGAPKVFSAWEGGYWGETRQDKLLLLILKHEAKKVTGISGELGLVTYLHNYNIGSVKELLPIYTYIYDDALGQVRYYPDNYPISTFLEHLNSTTSLAKLQSAVKITNVIGNNGYETITGFNMVSSTQPSPMWENGMPKDFSTSKSGVLIGNGDGTVPAISSMNFLGLPNNIINQDHGKVVSYAQSQVVKELTGIAPGAEIHNEASIFSLLMISLSCPADIQIIAPDGKRLGRDIAGSSTLAEIPGGYYYYSDDSLRPEYAIIPNPIDGEYQVKVVGTDNGGSYSIDTNYITDATSTESEYSGVILPGREQSLRFSFSSSSDQIAEIKSDITIERAINDVAVIYGLKLLTDKNAKKKIINYYESIRRKIEKQNKSKDRRHHENDKWQEKRQQEIIEEFSDLDEYLKKILNNGVLKQLGYDIIKSNNDYLINNW